MDKRISMFSGGRLKVVALVCILAVLVLPALAFATGTPTTSSTASVHLVWTPAAPIKTLGAKIAVGGQTHPATVVGNATASAFAYLTDGVKTVVATGRDNVSGLPVTEAWTLTVNEAPKLGAVTPGNGQSLTATPSAITVKYSDNTAVTAVVTATVNGVSQTPAFTATMATLSNGAVGQGLNTVVVTVRDAANNRSTKTWTFFNGQPNSAAACTLCHSGAGIGLGSTMKASGHNTTENGVIGGKTKWDGSQGVVVLDSTGAVIKQTWPLPTASVFWSQSNMGSKSPTDAPLVAMANRGFPSAASGAAAINTTVGWNSVVTCQDCHTGYNAVGPHAAAVKAGLDPNFPDDWTNAEITSFDPTGMRSIATTVGSANPYYAKLGGNVYMPAEITSGGVAVADQAAAMVGLSIETTTQKVWGAPSPSVAPTLPGYSATATKTVYPGGFYGLTNVTSTGYSAGTVTGRFICQKCHKLTNSFQGLSIEGNGRGFRDNNLNYMGMSNEAHMEHHNDMVTGQGNCVSCHIAIPHGWKRPRLLVYESDPASYKVQKFFPNFATNPAADDLNADLSGGNWGFQGWNGTGTKPTSKYIAITVTNAYTGALSSTHIDKLSASESAEKELEAGACADEWSGYDAQNGTQWSNWDMSALGVAWPGDTNAAGIGASRITLSAWDLATNKAVSIPNGDSPIQNNCNACTSASGTTHAPQYKPDGTGFASGNEGVNGDASHNIPYWK